MIDMDAALQIIELLIQFMIGIGLFYVGYEANKIAKNNSRRISAEERLNVEKIFSKTQDAVALTMRKGYPSEEALNLIFRATLGGKLYLPESAQTKLEELSKILHDLYRYHMMIYDSNGEAINMDSPERTKHVGLITDLLIQLNYFDVYELFSGFLKIRFDGDN